MPVLISDDFVYLHMPKTGGGTIRNVLATVLPTGYVREGPHPYVHPGWELIPESAAELPVFVHVRNPWDYYVSWYSFHSRRRKTNPPKLWRSAFGDEPDFPTFLERVCSGRLEHDRPQMVELLRGGMDFYTARWTFLVGGLDDRQLTVGRFERLFEDLEAFLCRVGAPIPDDFIARAGDVPGVHVSSRGPYREYYDDRTRGIVERACAGLISRFGYRF